MSKNGLVRRGGEILIYQTEGEQTKLEVRLEGETLWLSQADLARLYQTTKQNISLHIQNIYEEGELEPGATIRKFRIVQTEGTRQVTREVDHYNLDMIISVGYRIKSHIATHFRQWATQRLRVGCVVLFHGFRSLALPPPAAIVVQARWACLWCLLRGLGEGCVVLFPRVSVASLPAPAAIVIQALWACFGQYAC